LNENQYVNPALEPPALHQLESESGFGLLLWTI
jgi:hypothetical protein